MSSARPVELLAPDGHLRQHLCRALPNELWLPGTLDQIYYGDPFKALESCAWNGMTVFPNTGGTYNVNLSFYQRGAYECLHGVADPANTIATAAHRQAKTSGYNKLLRGTVQP